MTNVEFAAKNLVREIRKSNEYNQYQRLYRKISRDGALMASVDLYREARFRIEMTAETDELQDALEALDRENAALLERPGVTEYLACEQRLCRMVRQVSEMVTDAAGLHLRL